MRFLFSGREKTYRPRSLGGEGLPSSSGIGSSLAKLFRDGKQLGKLAVFVLLLGALVYYVTTHWVDYAAMMNLNETETTASVGVNTQRGDDFFVEFRLEREKMQREQIDLIKKVIDDDKADKPIREAAYKQYLGLVDVMGKELKIEGILQAKGFESLVFLSGDACTVVVNDKMLDENDVSQIGDVVKRVTKIRLENVTVVPTER
jgi:hypothetical protein